ncbi:MAG: hypothetical protein ACAH10_00255, partial [Methylophilaceae bacterium]
MNDVFSPLAANTRHLSLAGQRLCIALTAILLGACTIWPDFLKPEMPVPATFKESGDTSNIGPWKNAEPADGLPSGKWWEVFGDTELNQLVEQVEISNQNIRV